MRSLLRPGFLVYAAAVCGASAFFCTLPLLRTLGYEYALASALVISLVSGLFAAALPVAFRRRAAAAPVSLFRLYGTAAAHGTLFVLIALAVSLLNGLLFVPFCDLTRGLVFFAWMPLFSAWLAAAMGLAAGLVTASARRGIGLFALLWLAVIGTGLYAFYSTPAVFVYNPFGGYFPGVLYDRVIRPSMRLATYRLGTLLEIGAVLSAPAMLYVPETVSLSLARFRPQGRACRAACLFTVAAVVFHLFGGVLGHRAFRSDLERHLSVHRISGLLDLYFPEDADPSLVSALTEDAAFSLHRAAEYFHIEPVHRIAVFFFRDADDKAQAMGAGRTNVAKPWRREVYVTLETPPHPVLRHELVHALSADFAPGPFAAAGKWGGLIPNPGLIEGLATAAGGPRGDLTVHQWARAMQVLDLLPPLRKLVGFGFFDLAAASAYTASGSFCDWIARRFGPKVLMEAYRTGDFETPTGHALDALEREWQAFLEEASLVKADLAAARARFDRTPILRTRCVHATAELCDEAWEMLSRGDNVRATMLLRRAHEKSGGSSETEQQLFYAASEVGDWTQVRAAADKVILSKSSPEAGKSAAREMLLDLDMSEHRDRDYAAAYARLADEAETEDRRRQLDVKAHLARTAVLNVRIFDALSLRPGDRSVAGNLVALLIAGEAAAFPEDPVRAYLLARQYFNAEMWGETLALLNRANEMGLDTAPQTVRLAARMLEGRALLFLGRFDDAYAVFHSVSVDETVREGLRIIADDFAARALFMRSFSTGAKNQ